MTGPAAPPLPESSPVRELFSLFRQLSQVTEEAFEALDNGEIEQFTYRVERREQILAATAPLLRGLQLLQQRGAVAHDPSLGAALAALQRAGSALHAQMQHLMTEISSRRDAVAAELRQLDRAHSAQVAYSQPAASLPPR